MAQIFSVVVHAPSHPEPVDQATGRGFLFVFAQPTLVHSWGADKQLTFLVRSFSAHQIAPPSPLPKWNINVVLRYLASDVFRSLRRLPFALLARRRAFLLRFASAARVSEAAAWAAEVDIIPRISATIHTVSSFLPKNTARHRLHQPMPSLRIPSLDSVPRDHVELRPCPVKSLRYFRGRALHRRGDCLTLFFPYTSTALLSSRVLARWIAITITDAYRWADPTAPLPGRPTVHELRAIAASYAALRNVSMDHILRQCNWGSQSIFTSTYLRDFHDLTVLDVVPVVATTSVLPAQQGRCLGFSHYFRVGHAFSSWNLVHQV
jgi:hypothetical protein